MKLGKDLPKSPYDILDPAVRLFSADDGQGNMASLLPPLVVKLRQKVKEFRDSNYQKASKTSRALLCWWFQNHNSSPEGANNTNFQYYFAQREAMETIIYLYDVVKARSKYHLSKLAATGNEDWLRFVIKMATGSGKTKVMSLVLAWSFFHKLYEEGSLLARNFLMIAPNIIVLDRLYNDFQGLNIFSKDPVLPDNGFEGHNWRDDFQLTLHKQDEIRVIRPTGNIFLTNIHRVYTGESKPASPQDKNTMEYFLGKKPVGKTTDSKVDLGVIVRAVSELMILNDEAHHIHDEKLAWFQSIQDIHNHLVQKGKTLSLQIDVTATPRHNNGAIFVQTISDYPLVEAIKQNVVKHPVIPDSASLSKLKEKQSTSFTQRYADYINLGVIEWRKTYQEYLKLGKKTILFVMTTDTRQCDEVAEYLPKICAELKDAVLVIHTNNNGDISEAATGKKQAELDKLRKLAATIDNYDNPYKAVVSVMMLKEGWDVRNVTTIVGLRPYSAKSNILPEQTLGRGLRRICADKIIEKVSVIGTQAFMEFIKTINNEGVVLGRQAMGDTTPPTAPLVVEVDTKNSSKDLAKLDIEIPVLSPRYQREYKNLTKLELTEFNYKKIKYQKFNKEQQTNIVFNTIPDNKYDHSTRLDGVRGDDYRLVIGFFANYIMRDLGLIGGYDILYGKLKEFILDHLFTDKIKLDDPNTIRNLSEIEATNSIIETFKIAINKLTVQYTGSTKIISSIKLSEVGPFALKHQNFIVPKKSVFNLICGDSHFELDFAKFLERCEDVLSYAKNYLQVHFKLDYVSKDGNLANYYPDFIVRQPGNKVTIVETKGLEDLDVPSKMRRLQQWCKDVNNASNGVFYDFVFVDDKGFREYNPQSFRELLAIFTKYKNTDNMS